MPKTIDTSDANEDSYSSVVDSDVNDTAESSPTVADGLNIESSLTVADESNNSSLFESIAKSKMKVLAKKCETCDKLKAKFKNHTHTSFSNPFAKSFVATGLANCPMLLNASVSTFISCVINALLLEISLNIDQSKVATNYPSRTTLSNIAMD